ncbi:MAG TPA: hypothetical protein PKW42_02930, partial [bacterium]|nr:hypothetical protein [bacterium]
MKQLKQKCRFFLPDRPCVFHKEQGLTCQNCSHYQPGSGRLLIVKREALGDVLRTTALLQPLRKRFPEHRIIWLTARESQGLLKDNPWLDEVWTDDTPDTVANLTFFQFEVVINLDLSRESLLLAGLPQARTRIGFWYNPSGEIVCSGAAAENWLLLSHDDRAKKHNKLSYQRWMADIIGLKQIGQIFVPLPDVSLEYARLFAEKYRLSGQKVVGLNVGSGPAWVTKRWPEANWLELTQHLEGEAVLLLLGG